MSGSPKRVSVGLSAQRQQAMARARAARAAEQRATAEARRRKGEARRLERQRKRLEARLAASTDIVREHPQESGRDGSEQVIASSVDIRENIARASAEADFAQVAMEVLKLETEARTVERRRAVMRSDAEGRLRRLFDLADQVIDDARVFDPSGAAAVQHALEAGVIALETGDLQQFDRDYGWAWECAEAHVAAVTTAKEAWAQDAESAEAMISDLAARVEALREDAEQLPGLSTSVAPLAEGIALAQSELTQRRLDRAKTVTADVEQQLQSIETDLADYGKALEERTAVVQALQSGLGEAGLRVDGATVSEDASGAVTFRADHMAGWSVAVTLGEDDEGHARIEYDASDSEKQT